jgi:hypothetical protein
VTIRRKLSLLMLLLAATPLLIGAVVSRERMLHLGRLLTGLTREELIIRQERELSAILESHAETMRQRAGSLERVCLAQAAYAERLFSMMPKGAGAGSMPAMPRIAPSRRGLDGGGASYAAQDIHGALGFVAPDDRKALEAMLSIYQPLTVGIEEDMPIEEGTIPSEACFQGPMTLGRRGGTSCLGGTRSRIRPAAARLGGRRAWTRSPARRS